MQFNFNGHNVLVTGGSRGIGREISWMFAEAGARVALHYRANAEAAQQTLESLHGDGHFAVQGDLSQMESAQHIYKETVAAFGQVHVLVNNAGIYEEHPFDDTNFENWLALWERTLQTNLLSAAHLSYLFGKHMVANGGGRIVNVSSRGAFRGEPTAPAYGASKAGMNAMGQSLAQALAPHGVYVHTVAPGFVETDMAADILAGPRGDDIRNQSAVGRVATPEEVARTVLFCAAPGTEFLTGCIIDVNGASYLRS
jgi:3-oxoacyl-[acyl-carrier protein] reductase